MRNTKVVLTCVAVILLFANAFGQEDENPAAQIKKAKTTQTAGIVITSISGALLITGISLIIANGSSFRGEQTSSGVSARTNSTAAVVGIVVSIAAVPGLIAGLFKWTRGHDDLKYYKTMVEPKDGR
jgi:hypothetical protein